MTVEYIQHMGSDLMIINAMVVSTGKESQEERELTERDDGRIRYLMQNRHVSPFEHNALTVFVETPIAVAREWMRHRTQGYNEFSFRYSVPTELQFYTPDFEHLRVQTGKPGHYEFLPITDKEKAGEIMEAYEGFYEAAEEMYRALLDDGVARELARLVLPVGTMTKFYATAFLRNWFNFLSLRTASDAMREIRDEAAEVEELIAELWPVAYKHWNDAGRPELHNEIDHWGILV